MPVKEKKKDDEDKVKQKAPAFRYCADCCLEGKIIYTDKELKKLDKEGWKDHPGKVQLLAGFEYLFEG